MPHVSAHAPGRFCWVELGTTDQASATAFYSSLLGWRSNDVPMGDATFYTLFTLEGRDVAALYGLSADQRTRGIRPYWLPYVAVANADDTAAQVKRLGGRLLVEPFDVLDVGRTLLLRDPTGAVLACYQARTHHGLGIVGEPGSVRWCELATRDTSRAGEFYAGLFGWGMKSAPAGGQSHTYWTLAGESIGGMLPMADEAGDAPSHWDIYFRVADVDATATRARRLGGEVPHGPFDAPGVGRLAMLADSEGAGFNIIRVES
ncbi:MAG: VOC family protein [Gemmatimonadales bacterium]